MRGRDITSISNEIFIVYVYMLALYKQTIFQKNTTLIWPKYTHIYKVYSGFISRPTPRLLSFVLCLEWINGTYNTIHSRHNTKDRSLGVGRDIKPE